MPLVDEIKTQITAAMKSGDTVARDILRLALSEIQMGEVRKAERLQQNPDLKFPPPEEEAVAAVRKLIKSNEETLSLSADGEQAPQLRKELEVLGALLPKRMSVDDIVAALASQVDAIKAAKADGQATGIAMKYMKSTNADVSGNDVGAAVKKIRG